MSKVLRDVQEYLDRGLEQWEQRNFEASVRLYRQALWEFPDSVSLQLGLAYSYFYLKEYVNAVRCFEIVMRFQPLNKRALRGVGLCYLKLNRVADAQRVLGPLHADPDMPVNELMEIAYYFFQVKDYTEALNFCELVMDQESNYSDACICAGGSLHFLGQEPARKIALFHKAIELEPERLDLLDFFGNVLYDDLFMAEAMAIFERIPVTDMQNKVSLQRIIDLYAYFKVDDEIIKRYQDRLDAIQRLASVDGLVDSIMHFLDDDEKAKV